MSIQLNGMSALEAKIDKARNQMKSLKETSRVEFVKDAIEYYIDTLKKKKIIT